jgi:hypothetical protein
MSLTIQAPAKPFLSHFFAITKAAIIKLRSRRAKAQLVKHLRHMDNHLQHDINLDVEALWRPRPEIRMLQSPYLIASGCRD